jgi:hypothetical protein
MPSGFVKLSAAVRVLGMVMTVQIETGERTVLSSLLFAVVRAKHDIWHQLHRENVIRS